MSRKYVNEEGDLRLAPGDYGFDKGIWWARPPDPDIPMGNLASHEVTEHEDGTITVSPSILIEHWNSKTWHGFLEHGVWRQV